MIRKSLGIALLLLAGPALAADISYNYIQLDYGFVELEDVLPGVSVDGDGPGVSGSVEIGENWFIGAGYQKVDFDYDVEFEQIAAGLGFHTPIAANTDFFATLSYVQVDASGAGGSASENGYGATIGVRGMVSESLELDGTLGYVDLGDGADGTSFGAAAIYNFTKVFSLGVSVGFEEDATSYGAGVRFYFGK